MEQRLAAIASTMPKKTPKIKIVQDPMLQDLVILRMNLPRSADGRHIFKLTAVARRIITRDTRK